MVGCVEAITQSHLKPLLQDLLSRFPFPIRGFHSDNGSEFINDMVDGLLRDLLIEQTKSRARKSTDNGLVECKNGAVIRKHMGYGYIAAEHAKDIHVFFRTHFNPYLNFHRPCGQPERSADKRGKGEVRLQRLRYAVGNLAEVEEGVAAGTDLLQTQSQHRELGPYRKLAQRQPVCASDARDQTQIIPRLPTQANRGAQNCLTPQIRSSPAPWKCRAVELRGKPKPGFPPLSTALGNRSAIPTFPPRKRLFLFSSKTKERSSAPPGLAFRPSGPFFDWNMLGTLSRVRLG